MVHLFNHGCKPHTLTVDNPEVVEESRTKLLAALEAVDAFLRLVRDSFD